MIDHLPRVIPEASDRPRRGGPDHPMRLVTREVAGDDRSWGPGRAQEVSSFFDQLAGEWHTRSDPRRLEPVEDALVRGGPFASGLALELGSGTGLLSPWLSQRFPSLVAVDLAQEMIRRAPEHPPRLRADSSQLPVPDRSVAVALLINMILFPTEMDRILAEDGALVWVNTSGADTPIHLTAEEVDAALPGVWRGTASEAGWGTWAVLRRA